MSRGLKILTQDNTTLYDSTLLAGVNKDNITEDHFQGDKNSQNLNKNSQSEQTENDKEEEYKSQDKINPDKIAALSKEEAFNQTEAKEADN